MSNHRHDGNGTSQPREVPCDLPKHNGNACRHFDGLGEIWTDRLSRDALHNQVIAEITAHCSKCRASFFVEITGSPDRWVIRDHRITRDALKGWRHGGGPGQDPCHGLLRYAGNLPARRPRRIVVE